jgi:hypothetical protein
MDAVDRLGHDRTHDRVSALRQCVEALLEQHVVEATTKIGYPLDVIRPLGIICLACTILYAIPRTSILGAILLTGYLGGAIASKVRIEDPLFSSVLFGVYFGILVWGGLYLRDERLRALIPLSRD